MAKRPKKAPSARKASPRVVVVTVPQHITIDLPPVLHNRLRALSKLMDLAMEGVVR